MGTHPIFESDFDCLTGFRNLLQMSGTNDNKLLDGIADIVVDERNAKEREKYGYILSSAQRSTIEEMKERNKDHDLITTVSKQLMRYPVTFFCFGMTVRAFSKGVFGMVSGESAQAQHKWMQHRLRWQTLVAFSALGTVMEQKWQYLTPAEKQEFWDVMTYKK